MQATNLLGLGQESQLTEERVMQALNLLGINQESQLTEKRVMQALNLLDQVNDLRLMIFFQVKKKNEIATASATP